jgi:hypothetical protein
MRAAWQASALALFPDRGLLSFSQMITEMIEQRSISVMKRLNCSHSSTGSIDKHSKIVALASAAIDTGANAETQGVLPGFRHPCS